MKKPAHENAGTIRVRHDCAATAFPSSHGWILSTNSPLKKGDWLAAGVYSVAENRTCGVPVPFFQQAANRREH